jgi:Dyp-type peroxidase family
MLELNQIQSGVLRPRPTPYAATYLFLRIDDPLAGQALMRRAQQVVSSAKEAESSSKEAWISIALTFEGLKKLGVPRESLESFPPEFQQGMSARAHELGDTDESGPENWEDPFGTSDLHLALVGVAPDRIHLNELVDKFSTELYTKKGISIIGRQDCYSAPDEKEHFGYKDGIGQPAVDIEGADIPRTNFQEEPFKPGEFILGYPDEMGLISPTPFPELLGRNGSYVVIRKLYQRVGLFRKFLKETSNGAKEEELLAAKMMGRWRSGAPLALSPEQDDPELGKDSACNNNFLYYEDDKLGFKTPPGSHIRRMNPRDGLKESGTSVRIRRMIRRGTVYGQHLPEGLLEDDEVDRGLIFLFIGASLKRQFEFVQSTWLNNGNFIVSGDQTDPVTGHQQSGEFTIPKRPVRRKLTGLPRFVITRGGEYFFMPSINALKWLGEISNRE